MPPTTKSSKRTPADEKPSIRSRILDAAVKVFMSHGFNNSRLTQIALQAGVSRSSLYNDFPRKEDIIIAMNEMVAEEWVEITRQRLDNPGSASEAIRNWLLATLNLPEKYRSLIKIMHLDGGAPKAILDHEAQLAKIRSGQKWIRQCLKRGVESGEFRANLNINQAAHALQNIHYLLGGMSSIENAAINFLGEEGEVVINQVLQSLLNNQESEKKR